MFLFNYNEEFTPDTFAITDKDGNIVLGELPKNESATIAEYSCAFNGNEYSFIASFTEKPEMNSAMFAMAYKTAKGMTEEKSVFKSELEFKKIYSLLIKMLSTEVNEALDAESGDECESQSVISISEYGFFACFILLFMFLYKTTKDIFIRCTDGIDEFGIVVTAEQMTDRIPTVIYDYCIAVSRVCGFSLDVECDDDSLTAVYRFEKLPFTTAELHALDFGFDEDIRRALSLFLCI